MLTAAVCLMSCLVLVTSASALPPATWNKGDEKALFGHTFDEEYWTNESVKANATTGNSITFSASYVNYHDVQAFLLALNSVQNANGTGSVPFQLFGMHYYTPEGREVFISSVLAFLMVYNDTYNGAGPGSNGLPDPGNEAVSYVVPFGIAPLVNASYVPQTVVEPVVKVSTGHYRFGIRYLNEYALVTPNFVGSAMFRTGWLAKFSELSASYDITINNTNGQAKAETFYTIGQVTQLWFFALGVPIPASPRDIPANFGISVVHFVTVFTSKYSGAAGNTTGTTLNTNANAPLNQDVLLRVGNDNERAMKIGTSGAFDLINETSGATVRSGQTALAAILSAKAVDLLLVAWQLGFAAGAMSVFAYGLSNYVQSQYSGPLDLAQRSLLPTNNQGFNANPLWYAVSFPRWDGCRIVNDPTLTAYTNIAATSAKPPNIEGIVILLLIVAVMAVVAVFVLARRKGK